MNIDSKLRLSAQRALLDAVPVGLRAVSIEIKEGMIFLRSIFESQKSKDEHWESLSIAGIEIISDFPDHKITEEFLINDDITQKMKHHKHLVFMRKETDIS